MKFILTTLILFISFNSQGQNNYPIDPTTKKITFSKKIAVDAKKDKLYQRALQFLAVEDFERVLNIMDHRNDPQNIQLVKQSINYSNAEEGKIFGNGFLNFQYRGHNFFFLTFSYRIYVQDNEYKYIFTDFNVKEVYQMIRKESKINSWPLEEFRDRKKYEDSEQIFIEAISALKHQLKMAMIGEL